MKTIAPEVWSPLLELGRGTAREEMGCRGAIAERQLKRWLKRGSAFSGKDDANDVDRGATLGMFAY
jgi:hypothetical protein